jgi:NAD(P)-dependent dehydrogenase (short-subunit alcohol dehydrogenase family)
MAPRKRTDVLEVGEESYDQVMRTNLKGPFFLTQWVAKTMIDHCQRRDDYHPQIINISSISAYTSSPHRGEYCISKAGMGMITSLFADRLAEFGIGVYEIRPGIIATDMTSGVKNKYDQVISNGLTPIERWGTPEDVAKAVVAITEGYFPFSTGEIFNIDGGFHLRRL